MAKWNYQSSLSIICLPRLSHIHLSSVATLLSKKIIKPIVLKLALKEVSFVSLVSQLYTFLRNMVWPHHMFLPKNFLPELHKELFIFYFQGQCFINYQHGPFSVGSSMMIDLLLLRDHLRQCHPILWSREELHKQTYKSEDLCHQNHYKMKCIYTSPAI